MLLCQAEPSLKKSNVLPTLVCLSVVERIDSCASMYSRSIQGHHVCLLVKTVSEAIDSPPCPPLSLPPSLSSLSSSVKKLKTRQSNAALISHLQSGQTVSIDAKCDEPTLLGNVLDEIKQTFSQC